MLFSQCFDTCLRDVKDIRQVQSNTRTFFRGNIYDVSGLFRGILWQGWLNYKNGK